MESKQRDPTDAWKEISKTQKVIKINVKTPTTDRLPGKLRVVCMSDTHSLTSNIRFEIPDGDIFIHAGDFTKCGGLDEVIEFNTWIGKLPHTHKIVIAGNHELSFDKTFTHPLTVNNSSNARGALLDEMPSLGHSKETLSEAIETKNIKDHLTNCIYLEDEMLDLCGLKIYGTPWQPEFCKWAFNLPRGKSIQEKWDKIPKHGALDILVTHTPPLGHGDLCCSGVRAGCLDLLETVQQSVHPKYHIFGHVHEGYGVTSDGKIIFINASTCDLNYQPTNPPIVFDVIVRQP